MSQIAKLFDGTSSPDIETITGDVGGAVGPNAAFNLNLLTGDGLTSTGVVGANTITITLDGYAVGTGQTIGAVTADLITIPLGATPTTYTIEAHIAGFEATTPAGCGYFISGVAKTTGAAASLIGVPDEIVCEDAVLGAGDVDLVPVGNTIVVRALGVAGLTVNWKAKTDSIGV